jgi:hypothetical protein
MFDRVRLVAGGAIVGAVMMISSAAGAVVLGIQHFAADELAAAQAAADALKVPGEIAATADFEEFAPWGQGGGTQNPVTSAGSFAALGGTGYGGSVIGDATKLQVRNDKPMFWMRQNTSQGGNNWLDTNDTYGMHWDVGGPGSFNALSFILTDVADVGAKFSITVDGGAAFHAVFDHMYLFGNLGLQPNGGINVISILLPETVSDLTILLRNDILNDGFGIDSVRVALTPIPVPPAALLVLTGPLLLAGVRARRRKPA